MQRQRQNTSESAGAIVGALGKRSLVLVGLMGCGKTSVGKRLASELGLRFVDADDEIETAADKTIKEIFADHGEQYFRDGERRVIARLLQFGPQVLSTGGGAYMNEETRQRIKAQGVSIWLRAELPLLMRRVLKRENRPLLMNADPEAVMQGLMTARYPIYAEADIVVDSLEAPHGIVVGHVIEALAKSPVLGFSP